MHNNNLYNMYMYMSTCTCTCTCYMYMYMYMLHVTCTCTCYMYMLLLSCMLYMHMCARARCAPCVRDGRPCRCYLCRCRWWRCRCWPCDHQRHVRASCGPHPAAMPLQLPDALAQRRTTPCVSTQVEPNPIAHTSRAVSVRMAYAHGSCTAMGVRHDHIWDASSAHHTVT